MENSEFNLDSNVNDINETPKKMQTFVEVGPNPNPETLTKYMPDGESYFDGSVLELMAYHSLSAALTTITVGMGRPWAQCILNKYKYSHTVYSGKRLKFEGDPVDLFVKRFKWNFYRVVTFGIYSFWIPVNYKKWELEHVHFEDENLSYMDSYFTGTVLGNLGINIATKLITVVSFGLLSPLAHCIKLRWTLEHSVINRKVIEFKGSALDLFFKRLWWGFLTAITFGIYGLFLEIKGTRWEKSHTFLKKANGNNSIAAENINNNNQTVDAVHKKKKKSIAPFIILGIVLIAFIFLISKVVTLVGSSNPTIEKEIQSVFIDVQAEIYNMPPENLVNKTNASSSKEKDISNLDLSSLTYYKNNGGKGFYKNDRKVGYNEEIAILDLYLKKKSTICKATLTTNTQTLSSEVTCESLRDYYIGKYFGGNNNNNNNSKIITEDSMYYGY